MSCEVLLSAYFFVLSVFVSFAYFVVSLFRLVRNRGFVCSLKKADMGGQLFEWLGCASPLNGSMANYAFVTTSSLVLPAFFAAPFNCNKISPLPATTGE